MRYLAAAMGLFVVFALSSQSGNAASLPKGASFIGLQNDIWNVFVVPGENASPHRVKTVSEPRSATFNVKRSVVAYIAANGALREVNISTGEDRTLLEPNGLQAFTQPAYNQDGTKLLLVLMKNGTSNDTEIGLLDLENTKKITYLTSQPGSQFEPRFSSDQMIVYSSVSCVLGCGKTIQEIWQKNIVTETAEQMTLLNALSRQPVSTPDKSWLYFSSNNSGRYHIWKIPYSGGAPQQVTEGLSIDLSPIAGEGDQVCFIRKTSVQSNLICLLPDGVETIMELPDNIENIRDLEIVAW